jgi:hypothetical protein
MRVALFLSPDLPVESGEPYAFKRELLQAIANYAGGDRSEFYVSGLRSLQQRRSRCVKNHQRSQPTDTLLEELLLESGCG